VVCARLIFRGLEVAANERFDTEDGKKVGTDLSGFDLLRPTTAGDGQDGVAGRAHVSEDMVTRFPVDEVGGGGRIIGGAECRAIFPDLYQAGFVLELERAEEDGVCKAEDRDRAADAERQGQDGSDGEAGVFG
jgi:hypothetical protein